MEFGQEGLSKAKIDLILAAEHLIGNSGINEVSLRKIAEFAENKNVMATQYHFGTKENLIQAVIFYRRAEMEQVRLQMFANAGKSLGDMSAAEMAALLVMPPFLQRNAHGARSYSRFYRAVISYLHTGNIWRDLEDSAPFTFKLVDALRGHMPLVGDAEWTMRSKAQATLSFNMIADYDLGRISPDIDDDAFIRVLTQMVIGVLSTN